MALRYPLGVRSVVSLLIVLGLALATTGCILKFDTRPVAERSERPRASSTVPAAGAKSDPAPDASGSDPSPGPSAAASDAPSDLPSDLPSEIPPEEPAVPGDESVVLAAVGDPAAAALEPVPVRRYRDRLRRVEIGQSIEAVHERLGNAPVRRSRRDREPIPAPRYTVEFERLDGAKVRLESWVVKVWRRDGCPDFTFDDVPITYVDGVVFALDWETVEWEWEKWGGDLSVLRAAQDRFTCNDPNWSEEAEDSGDARQDTSEDPGHEG